MPRTISTHYQVTQACDFDEECGHFNYQPAGDPEQPAVSVCPVETEDAARALMQSCFEAERFRHPGISPAEFRIEQTRVVVLDHVPTCPEEA